MKLRCMFCREEFIAMNRSRTLCWICRAKDRDVYAVMKDRTKRRRRVCRTL